MSSDSDHAGRTLSMAGGESDSDYVERTSTRHDDDTTIDDAKVQAFTSPLMRDYWQRETSSPSSIDARARVTDPPNAGSTRATSQDGIHAEGDHGAATYPPPDSLELGLEEGELCASASAPGAARSTHLSLGSNLEGDIHATPRGGGPTADLEEMEAL
jgi:hypothetical protein